MVTKIKARTSGRLAGVSAGILLIVCLAGCGGYRLGTTLPAGVKSVHVPTFVNECGEPQVENETTKATIQELQKDGTLRLANARKADCILTVKLARYDLDPLRYEKDRPKTTREYRLKLTAHISLKRTRTNEVLVEKWVAGETTFIPAGSLAASKRSALPNACRDLAHDIVESIVEYW